jgi:hypothetical protein
MDAKSPKTLHFTHTVYLTPFLGLSQQTAIFHQTAFINWCLQWIFIVFCVLHVQLSSTLRIQRTDINSVSQITVAVALPWRRSQPVFWNFTPKGTVNLKLCKFRIIWEKNIVACFEEYSGIWVKKLQMARRFAKSWLSMSRTWSESSSSRNDVH